MLRTQLRIQQQALAALCLLLNLEVSDSNFRYRAYSRLKLGNLENLGKIRKFKKDRIETCSIKLTKLSCLNL